MSIMHSIIIIATKLEARQLQDLYTMLHFLCKSSCICAATTALVCLSFAPWDPA